MIAVLFSILLSIFPNQYRIIDGYLSAYDLTPTLATIEYRQEVGDIPDSLAGFDGVVAVQDCSLIGTPAILISQGHVLHVMIFDCAGHADGGYQWMSDNNIVGEVGYRIREKYPSIVGAHALLLIGGFNEQPSKSYRYRSIR